MTQAIWQAELSPEADAPGLDGEWLVTNGLGGFAMGTAAACNARRYHGLLVAPLHPPVERINTVSMIGETLDIDGHPYELFNCEFGADEGRTVFHPAGWRYLKHFEKDTACRWTYEAGGVRLTKTLRLVWQKNVAVVTYRVEAMDNAGPEGVTLKLLPFVSLRDFHHLRYSGAPSQFRIRTHSHGFEVTAGELPPLRIAASRGQATSRTQEWRNIRYRIETERGQDDTEALLVPGEITCHFAQPAKLSTGERTMTVAIALEAIDWSVVERQDARATHLRRIVRYVQQDVADAETSRQLGALAVAGDDFVVRRSIGPSELSTILAGYPWFADWGRDTMISLEGLLLCTGRFEEAQRVLVAYARHVKDGLIPNRFDDYGGEPHYNTVDASLWFVHASLQYMQRTHDQQTWRDYLHMACRQIVNAYRDGVPACIGMDRDGLIGAGSPDTQLTWMDAKRDGVVFTPRHGKAVEINALWHRALCGLSEMGDASDYGDLAALVKQSFAATFWDEELGYCVDHVNEHGADRSLRPNQVFAVSLPHSPLPRTKQKAVMTTVRNRLLTPMGLRTLPVDDAAYHGKYTGTMFERDRAYHQGTTWAWLIGPYVEGYLRANQFSAAAIKHARSAIAPLLAELGRHSYGQLHEVFDGDAPHTPAGCMAQAWSVAETLRALMLIERGE